MSENYMCIITVLKEGIFSWLDRIVDLLPIFSFYYYLCFYNLKSENSFTVNKIVKVPSLNITLLLQNSLVIDTPRIRKQTRPFSATKDELAELSEAESEGEEKPKLRRPCDRSSGYGRTECFRVEKNLLVYG